jgi:mannose-1-phosphate guanylyltransferase/phosphomannomutase
MKVFLPTWAPDIVDYENLEIERGVYSNFRADKLKEYDLIATIDGNFAFTEFTLHRDAMYATLKILEMMIRHDVKLSELGQKIHPFYYKTVKIECPQALKGKMMRKFIEIAKDRKHSTVDGVKIWENETDWILMIPDAYGDYLNLYIQASDEAAGERLYKKYADLIETWMKE